MIRVVRWLCGALGVGLGLFGAALLVDLGWDNLKATGTWLIGGVILHDAVLAPTTIVLAYLSSRALGVRLPGPVIVGAIVLGSLTLVAVPVLGREDARPNPTLLDRPYVLGWFLAAGLTLLCVTVALLRDRRSRRPRRAAAPSTR